MVLSMFGDCGFDTSEFRPRDSFSGLNMNVACCDAHAFANMPIRWYQTPISPHEMPISSMFNIRDSNTSELLWDSLLRLDKGVASCDTHVFANTPIGWCETLETPNWLETPEVHFFKFEVPGMKKEDMKVQVSQGKTLEISGERKEEVQKDDTWHCVERVRCSFLRRFRLPAIIDVDKVKAQLMDGVLTVTIQKVEKPKP